MTSPGNETVAAFKSGSIYALIPVASIDVGLVRRQNNYSSSALESCHVDDAIQAV
jgi:hypothetical protein